MVPLGLNVISPRLHERHVGFTPVDFAAPRRGSAASVSSNLTNTRPRRASPSSPSRVKEGFTFGVNRAQDVFAEAEAAEADRQKREFLAATYGGDGKRARERLSLASSHSPGTRRPSLMLWEKLGKQSTSAPALPLPDERRGSLPIAIPQPEPPKPIRPLPPLLPLSDPGPRLLPSTLALHRATHLLNSKNLQADPLPAPLPPSLHPPAPVDLAEFDIDFILAGASETSDIPAMRLDGDDTFAKFVGEFDDEYGGRRGEWTFRESGRTWTSPGAGVYEIDGGDVRCSKTGSVWKTRRISGTEVELERQNMTIILTTKAVHIEAGGYKRYKRKKGKGFGNAIRRGFASMLSDDKRVNREEKERERIQSRSWSGNASRVWVPKTTTAWTGVPDNALAMVLPIDEAYALNCDSSLALLVWYVPFTNQELPWPSFRAVARIINIDELKTISTPSTSGRAFPTVIAVCHARAQGVEFVLEGLDRLGLCAGDSAWGPTGYEEWRGTGLSANGRDLLDTLWAGCIAVLGI